VNSADQCTPMPLTRVQGLREPRTPQQRSRSSKIHRAPHLGYSPILGGGSSLAREPIKSSKFEINGLSGQLCNVAGDTSWCVTHLKKAVETALGVPVLEQRFFIGTRELHDVDQLHSMSVNDVTSITFVRRSPAKAALLRRLVEMDRVEFAREPEEVRSDRDVAFAIVCENGDLLQLLAKPLRGDREVVTAAVKSVPWAIRHASDALKADRELMLSVVRQVPNLLGLAADDLKGDRDFVLTCMQGEEGEEARINWSSLNPLKALHRSQTVLSFAARKLREDPELRSAAGLDPCSGN